MKNVVKSLYNQRIQSHITCHAIHQNDLKQNNLNKCMQSTDSVKFYKRSCKLIEQTNAIQKATFTIVLNNVDTMKVHDSKQYVCDTCSQFIFIFEVLPC